ncbi:MAG: HisA/HisF-related TIM barrel protein [Nitrospiraceae bacterium]
MAELSSVPVIASGGISRVEDLTGRSGHWGRQIEGAIVGKALYDGKLDYRAAVAALGATPGVRH